jgi:hypothetical protein
MVVRVRPLFRRLIRGAPSLPSVCESERGLTLQSASKIDHIHRGETIEHQRSANIKPDWVMSGWDRYLLKKDFRGVSEQQRFKASVERATSIERSR